jgi:UDP-N-acetylmuramyl pentapeptide phosphotransferase/UDP-N-acetylglucosamine-1-phosphate transferase
LRLAAHGIAAAAGLAAMPATLCLFQGALPLWADRAVCLVAWVWFINLYNFMDGIDGLSGVESASLGIGIGLISPMMASAGAAGHAGTVPEAYAVAAVSIGFLWWNWQPARIFLGDSGSVPLGYLIGWLLLDLAMRGLWLSALILPAYYLTDATLTLARRLRRGEKVWEAHRSHFYQMAVRAGASHAAVATLVLIGNTLLIGLAVLATTHPWVAAGGAAFVVALMLATMAGRAVRPIVR